MVIGFHSFFKILTRKAKQTLFSELRFPSSVIN